jgi:site-specific DNA recombinase
MIAAVYARKSTDELDKAPDARSCERQIAQARAYASRQGWTVVDAHVYMDEAVSGAQFDRPGLGRLLAAIDGRPPFDVLIISEQSRLGRATIPTLALLQQLVVAGVRVFTYLDDREITLDDEMGEIQAFIGSWASSSERRKARQRTAEALARKAGAGHSAGGRVFGYRNVCHGCDQDHGAGRGHCAGAHVERRVHPDEAAVVERIFTLCAEGRGLRGIALTLNASGALAPVPRRAGRPHGWAPSSVRAVLHRPLYRGEIVWNRTQKRDRWGKKKQSHRPEAAWIRREAPALRIVPEELWRAAHERLDGVRQAYLRGTDGRLWGRPGSGIESKYLLTGLAICGACGRTLHVRTRSHGRKRAAFYGCSAHHLRGTSVCANRLELPMVETNEALLAALEEDLLHPDAIALGLREAVDTITAPSSADGTERCAAIRREIATTDGQLAILKAALLQGGPIATLVDEMKAQERRKAALTAELQQRERPVEAVDVHALEAELLRYVAEWRAVLRQHVTIARQMLRKLVVGRVCFTPKGETAEMVAPLSLDGMLATATLLPKAVVAPTGSVALWTFPIRTVAVA